MKRLLFLLFMFISLALNAQMMHTTTDRKLELYIDDSGYSIYVSNKYNTAIGIFYKYAVSVISKENKKEIDSYVITESYGCVEANSIKQLRNLTDKLRPDSKYIFQITNVYIDDFFETNKCNN